MEDDTGNVTPSLRAALASLVVAESDERGAGYNAALRDVLTVFDRHEAARKKSSKQALTKLKRAGKKIGGDLPYGYELAADGTTLQEAPAEQRVIAEARKLRAAGHSLRGVARQLEDNQMHARESDAFCAAQIKRMTDEEPIPQFAERQPPIKAFD